MVAGVAGSEALLVGGFGGCLDMTGAVRTALEQLHAAVGAEIESVFSQHSAQNSDRFDK